MAELFGLAASIIQIAGAGAKLSTALYTFVSSAARADHEINDIADDVQITANALEGVGLVFSDETSQSVVSVKAMQDARNLITRCEAVFEEIRELVEKRRKVGKGGKSGGLTALGKLSWPMKEQRVQLLRSRLESLKSSLMLLLQVLKLANGQAKGKIERSALEEERQKIRELHHRQQESLKTLNALESTLGQICLDDGATLYGSNASSRTPTMASAQINLISKTMSRRPEHNKYSQDQRAATAQDTDYESSETEHDDSDASDSEQQHLTLEDLAKCADHVSRLLKKICKLQRAFEEEQMTGSSLPKRRVQKLYRRFCRRIESEVFVTGDHAPTVTMERELPAFEREHPALSETIESAPVSRANRSTTSLPAEHDPSSTESNPWRIMKRKNMKGLMLANPNLETLKTEPRENFLDLSGPATADPKAGEHSESPHLRLESHPNLTLFGQSPRNPSPPAQVSKLPTSQQPNLPIPALTSSNPADLRSLPISMAPLETLPSSRAERGQQGPITHVPQMAAFDGQDSCESSQATLLILQAEPQATRAQPAQHTLNMQARQAMLPPKLLPPVRENVLQLPDAQFLHAVRILNAQNAMSTSGAFLGSPRNSQQVYTKQQPPFTLNDRKYAKPNDCGFVKAPREDNDDSARDDVANGRLKQEEPDDCYDGSEPSKRNATGPFPGNHSLQDYQMRLMLLEQQNNKRFLMARQEQNNATGPSPQGNRPGSLPNSTDPMKWNPLISPVADSVVNDMQFANNQPTPGAYFGPLTSPARNAQPPPSIQDPPGTKTSRSPSSMAEDSRVPITISCTMCRSRHLKCDGGEPCSRCKTESVECVYVKSGRGWKGRKSDAMGGGDGPSRRSHTKSRKSCTSCKRRHIRCGEQYPTCRHCVKANIQCDFSDKELATPGTGIRDMPQKVAQDITGRIAERVASHGYPALPDVLQIPPIADTSFDDSKTTDKAQTLPQKEPRIQAQAQHAMQTQIQTTQTYSPSLQPQAQAQAPGPVTGSQLHPMGFGQMPSPQPQMMDQAQAMPMMNRPLIPQSGSQLHNASNEVNIPMGQIAHVRRTETLLGDSGLRSMPPSLQQSQIMAQRRQDSQVGYPWQPQNLQHRGAKENVLQFQDNWQKMEQMATANQRGLLRQLQSMQPQRLREQQQRQQQYMGQEPIMQSGRRPSQPEIPLTYQTGQNVPMDLFSDSHMSNPPEIQSSPEGDNQDTSQGKGLAEPSRNPFAYTVSSSTAEPSYMSIKDPVAFLFGSEPNTDYQYDAGVGHNTKTTTGMKSILNNTLGWERDDIPKQSRSLSPNPGPESISRTRIKRPANAVDGSSEEEDSPGNRKRLKTSEDDPHPIFTRTQVNFDAIHKSVIPGTEKLEEKDIVDVLLDQWTVDVNGICA